MESFMKLRHLRLSSTLIPRVPLLLGAAALLATSQFVACKTTPEVDAGPDDQKKVPKTAEADGPLDGTMLNGTKLTTVEQGPWLSRGVNANNASRREGGRGGMAAEEGGRMMKSGAPPPTSSAPPMEGEADMESSLAPSGPIGGAPLRAGSTDDNAAFDAFLKYRQDWRGGIDDPLLTALDVTDRRWVEVVDEEGKPVPGALVEILDAKSEALVWRATTYGDGRAFFFPRVFPAASKDRGQRTIADDAAFLVLASKGDAKASGNASAQDRKVTVTLPKAAPLASKVPLDVTFLIDTTGSMGDEIARIKASLLKVTEKVRSGAQQTDLRYGAVLYRDLGDAYVTSRHPFTADVEKFDSALQAVSAGGGGDFAESMNQGLLVAVDQMQWRADAAKLVFLIADAPPHTDYQGDVPYQVSAVRGVERGVKVHAVAASGLDPLGTLAMRQVAQATRGKFIFIEYGKPGETAKSHGVANPSSSNNLDDILYEQIQQEVSGYGQR